MVAVRARVDVYLLPLALEWEEEETLIAVAELLGFVDFAARQAQAGAWRGKLIVHVGDNMNVQQWLLSRAPRAIMARRLIRVLNYLELTGGFAVIPTYIRTYHNVTADDLSRCSDEEAPGVAQEAGLELVDLAEQWRSAVKACTEERVAVLLGWDPLDHRVAL